MEGEIFEAIFQLLACLFEALIEFPGLLEYKWARWFFGIAITLIIAATVWFGFYCWRY